MDSSKIKNLLLKSGVPLEVSVVKKLAKFGVEDHGEVEYERNEKIFTTDINLRKNFNLIDNLGLTVNFVIECKYKTRNHQWFFMKFPEEFGISIRRKYERNEVFDKLFKPLLVKRGYQFKQHVSLWDFRYRDLFGLKTADKGVDILENKEQIIRKAVFQAVFGSIKVHRDSIQYNVHLISDIFNLTKKENMQAIFPVTSITIPIIVTTAKLFRVKDNISVEDIEKEKDIFNLCEEQKGILLINKDYSNVRKFSEDLEKSKPIYFSNKLIDWMRSFEDAEYVAVYKKNVLEFCHPGFVYIMNYESLEELFSTCLKNIEELCKAFPKKYVK